MMYSYDFVNFWRKIHILVGTGIGIWIGWKYNDKIKEFIKKFQK